MISVPPNKCNCVHLKCVHLKCIIISSFVKATNDYIRIEFKHEIIYLHVTTKENTFVMNSLSQNYYHTVQTSHTTLDSIPRYYHYYRYPSVVEPTGLLLVMI